MVDGAAVLEADRDFQHHRGVLERIEAWLSTAFSDDAAVHRNYLQEAARGHTLVMAHAADAEAVERVRQVLHAYGAHTMRHYGALTITDLY